MDSTTLWARRRKMVYTGIVVGALLIIGSVQLLRMLHEPPTCFDGRQNQNETGVDCGGDCLRVCEEDTTPLRVLEAEWFEIREGVYTAVAQIENSNDDAGIRDLSYTFEMQGQNGNTIETIEGSTYVTPDSRFPVFVGPFELSDDPSSVAFTVDESPVWIGAEAVDDSIKVEDTTLLGSESSPKLRSVVRNTTLQDLEDVNVVALVSGVGGTIVAASRTVVDVIPQSSTEEVVFTWPEAFEKSEQVCDMPVGVVLALDRSGSMNDDGQDPPQPISDVRDAAETFVANLREPDKAGVVSFSTEASDPIDLGLTSNRNTVGQTISDITIRPEDEQSYTNIGAAIQTSYEEIQNAPSFGTEDREFVIVLLTDGQANYPQTPGGEVFAREHASVAKRMGISFYTIGLGEGVNRDFLQDIATAPNYYFEAASTDDLQGIYEEIGTSICTQGPAVIELFPRYNNVPELK